MKDVNVRAAALLLLSGFSTAHASTLKTITSFTRSTAGTEPGSGLIYSGGQLYGTTNFGGASDKGVLYQVDPATGKASTLADFATQGPSSHFQTPGANQLLAYGGLLYGTTQNGGTLGEGSLFKVDPITHQQTILHNFGASGDGARPVGALVALNGLLYGVCEAGGAAGNGTIFSVDPSTGAVTTLYSADANFITASPEAGLTVANGVLYGTTPLGGSGAVFTFDPKSGTTTKIYHFSGGSDGGVPFAPLTYANGKLYGTSASGGSNKSGTLFSIDPTTNSFTALASLAPGWNSGANHTPIVGLVYLAGNLYGTTYSLTTGVGSVFCYSLQRGALSQIHAFAGSPDAAGPTGLVAANGRLLGTGLGGGAGGRGAIFVIDPSTNKESLLYSFNGTHSDVTAVSGQLNKVYAVDTQGGIPGYGGISQLDTATNALASLFSFTVPRQGIRPNPPFTPIGAFLWGTTTSGGANDSGTIIKIDTTTRAETVVYSFKGGTDGAQPLATLTLVGSTLWGTTSAGGTTGCGTIFKLAPATGQETIIHNFSSPIDGCHPAAALLNAGGKLYGTTAGDAFNSGLVTVPKTGLRNKSSTSFASGTVFETDPTNNTFNTLHAFTPQNQLSPDGSSPQSALILVGKLLYGTTVYGGAGGGTVYSVDPASGAETILQSFGLGATGPVDPKGGLVSSAGKLYGTAAFGGSSNYGLIFSVDVQTNTLSELYSFSYKADGAYPTSSLIPLGNAFYGTTNNGGAWNAGTIFKFFP